MLARLTRCCRCSHGVKKLTKLIEFRGIKIENVSSRGRSQPWILFVDNGENCSNTNPEAHSSIDGDPCYRRASRSWPIASRCFPRFRSRYTYGQVHGLARPIPPGTVE